MQPCQALVMSNGEQKLPQLRFNEETRVKMNNLSCGNGKGMTKEADLKMSCTSGIWALKKLFES